MADALTFRTMASFAQDIRSARLAVERVLDEIGLDAYLYTVEPKESGWSLHVECAAEDGWKQVTMPVDRDELRASLHDAHVRGRLRRAWGPHFASGRAKLQCKERIANPALR
jgi:hypothetical protein